MVNATFNTNFKKNLKSNVNLNFGDPETSTDINTKIDSTLKQN